MTYGHDLGLFTGSGPVFSLAPRSAESVSAGHLAWRALKPESRLALVDKALGRPANDDLPDGLPVAL